jgi:hypothetical protein
MRAGAAADALRCATCVSAGSEPPARRALAAQLPNVPPPPPVWQVPGPHRRGPHPGRRRPERLSPIHCGRPCPALPCRAPRLPPGPPCRRAGPQRARGGNCRLQSLAGRCAAPPAPAAPLTLAAAAVLVLPLLLCACWAPAQALAASGGLRQAPALQHTPRGPPCTPPHPRPPRPGRPTPPCPRADLSPRLHRQPALRHHGLGLAQRHGRV